MADKGHNVTVLSTDIDGKAPQNVTYVHMEGVYDYMYKDLNVDLVSLHKETSTEAVMSLYAFGTVSCLGIHLVFYHYWTFYIETLSKKVLLSQMVFSRCFSIQITSRSI